MSGNEGEGEVYTLAYHVVPDRRGGWIEDIMGVRYLDRYRKEADGAWRFAQRVVVYDYRVQRPMDPNATFGTQPLEATMFKSMLFARRTG